MKPSQLRQLLAFAIPQRFNVLIVGAPGIGKTDLVHLAAKDANCDLLLSHPAVQDPTAASGLPWIDGKGSATHLPFGQLAKAISASRPTVWFLDDLGQAPPAVQAAYMQLLLAREIDGQRISDHVTFIAATNRRGDRAGVSGILEPVKSRFRTIVELECCPIEWRAWAFKHKLPTELIAFMAFKPSLLMDFKPTAELTNSPSPRGWSSVAGWLKSNLPMGILQPAIAGAVGSAAAGEFTAFLEAYHTMPDPLKVLANPDAAPIPRDISVLWALTSAIGDHVAAKNTEPLANAAIAYTRRLITDQRMEMAALLTQDLTTRCPAAANSLAMSSLLTDKRNGLTPILLH